MVLSPVNIEFGGWKSTGCALSGLNPSSPVKKTHIPENIVIMNSICEVSDEPPKPAMFNPDISATRAAMTNIEIPIATVCTFTNMFLQPAPTLQSPVVGELPDELTFIELGRGALVLTVA